MQANANAVRMYDSVSRYAPWEGIKAWAGRVITRERIVEVAVVASTVVVLALPLFSLHKAIQNRTITVPSPYLSAYEAVRNVTMAAPSPS